MYEVCKCIIEHGFKKILILNGHFGNTMPILNVLENLRDENVLIVATDYYLLASEGLGEIRESPMGGVNHAGEMETSVQLAVRPHLVDLKKAKKIMPTISKYVVRDLLGSKKVYRTEKISEITDTGSWGDPTLASPEKGEKFIESAVDALEEFLRHFKNITQIEEL